MNIRNVEISDLNDCDLIESACFEESEAASKNSIKNRIETYPAGFIVAEIDGKVVGMINSGATDKDDITDEEFKKLIGHSENGKNIVIFSVSVLPEFQGQKIATKLIKDFIKRSQNMGKEKILLLCKDDLINFYKSSGFEYDKISESTHGGVSWHEMAYTIRPL